jgi:predicted transcriptional regulator of viral defense system
MATKSVQPGGVWAIARRQHGVVTRRRLLANGYTSSSVRHKVSTGRLHRVFSGVYAVGRPALTRPGRWMAAVLACGLGAVLSHESAAALWGIRPQAVNRTHVSVPGCFNPRPPGIAVHRRPTLSGQDHTRRDGIPVEIGKVSGRSTRKPAFLSTTAAVPGLGPVRPGARRPGVPPM